LDGVAGVALPEEIAFTWSSIPLRTNPATARQ
jgi:hypothetical protein